MGDDDFYLDPTDYERELIEDSRTTVWGVETPEREPVSERLRLHYIGGAHVGLRGEWARLIREETATLAEISRRYARLRRDLSLTPYIDDWESPF